MVALHVNVIQSMVKNQTCSCQVTQVKTPHLYSDKETLSP